MLQLILGVSGTGKTGRVLADIKVRALKKKKSILLTPEQFSSSAETMLYRALGDELGAFAEAYSFTSLAERVLKTFGGAAVKTLTEPARVVAVRRAMDTLDDALSIYRRHRRSMGFCGLCADAVNELKTAGASPEAVLTAAQSAGEDGAKLYELGLIYAAYERVIAGSAMDPADRITVAAGKLDEAYLRDIAVFIDGFDGFTAPEYKMLEKLVLAQECVVTLCCDSLSEHDGGLGLFSPVRRTGERLRRVAAKQGAGIAKPYTREEDLRHARAPGLAAVAQCLAFGETKSCDSTGFYVTGAKNVYDECKRAACRIAALVREKGLRYADIAVICRQLDEYAAPLRYEFGLADIPYFADETQTIEHAAPAVFFTAALELLRRGMSSEALLRLLKTDLCGFDADDIAKLENYAYTWDLTAAEWREPFFKDPAGFGVEMSGESRELLSELEALRGQIMERVQPFLARAREEKTAAGISKRLYELLIAFGGDAHTEETARAFKEAGDTLRAREIYAAWNNIMALLEQMEQLLGADEISPTEYAELFALLLRSAKLGRVPQTQDTVLVTTADRMRLDRPKVCFVLGVSEGHFPRLLGASGLLSHTDRDLLVKSGVEMPGSYENRTLMEQMFFYRALTSPEEALYVSYVSPKGDDALLSAAMKPLLETLCPPADVLTDAERAPTPAAALDLLGALYRDDTPVSAALEAALQREGAAPQSLAAMHRAAAAPHFCAKDKAQIEALLGKDLSLSPTRVEQYYRCRFSYFLQYALRIRPQSRAELSPLNSGSLVHYILERVLRGAGGAFTSLSERELTERAEAAGAEYVKTYMAGTGERFSFLVGRICAETARLLRFIQKEQKQSGFHPAAFELAVGGGENSVPPLTLRTPDGHTVRVCGKIDRVDVMESADKTACYLRVIDYKTGAKGFKLEEVYCGLNTQMLLYLFTLCAAMEENAPDGKKPVAAGVLYLIADPPPQTTDREEAALPVVYQVDGLVLDDEAVLRGMDRDKTGQFLPVQFNKDGTPRKTKKLADSAVFMNIREHLKNVVKNMVGGLYEGDIDAVPLCSGQSRPCEACEYRPVCLHEDGRGEARVAAPPNPFAARPKEDTPEQAGQEEGKA